MMNGVALCLILATLATAGVWSPAPEKVNMKEEDVIVKEGHRTVVVEFEKDNGNTKVSISPQDVHEGLHRSSKFDHEKGTPDSTVENVMASAGELVCDAFGKCKRKIESAIGKTKEMVSEKAHHTAEKISEVEEEAEEGVSDALGKAKDTLRDKAHEAKERAKWRVKDAASEVSDKAKEAKERVKDAASEVSEKAKEGKERVKDAASGVSDKAKEMVAEKANGVGQGFKETADIAHTLKGDVERNVSNEMEAAKGKASEKAKQTGQKIGRVSEELEKRDLKDIFRRGREVLYDVFGYIFTPESMASGMGIVQLLSLAIAYGMSFWVTFVSSYILARALPRQQFAILQSKIYPVYFRIMAYSVGTVLVGHLLRQSKRLSPGAGQMVQGLNLSASLLSLLFNLRYLEPRATKVMFERMKLEKEEGRGLETSAAEPTARVVDSVTEPSTGGVSSTPNPPSSTPMGKAENAAAKSEMGRLSEELKKLNSYSSFLNVLTLMALTWHLVHLGQGFYTVC